MSNGSATFNLTDRVLKHLTDFPQVKPFAEHLLVMTTFGDCPIFSLPTDHQFAPPSLWSPHASLPRPEKDGAATSVDAICTSHPDPMDHGREHDRDAV
ncbi:hypothetical protein HPG69_004342 [Diceros bicornis minor]|uniref:Uncharacterized protein n=1 Tax=Diceros bicornis minor TaxID=77932 RepID=A0A7J7F4R2_DICBM|nr:hypothetical protein HPG69_004342 [Diceros bicornis minor]